MISKMKKWFQFSLSFLKVWLHWRTLGGASWRFAVAVCDWRTHLRKLKGQPIVDGVAITNMRDRVDRLRFLGLWKPQSGHFNGPRYWTNGIAVRTRALNITAEELGTPEGREKAKKLFIKACKWAEEHGARVILLAAGTKRLFGSNGTHLKKLFPNLIFTIGDNGTNLLLIEEMFRAIKLAKLEPNSSRIAVLGPSGFLGKSVIEALTKNNFTVIGMGSNKDRLRSIQEKYNIETCQTFQEMGKVDAVIACSHGKKVRLTADIVSNVIRKEDKRLLVVDVCEPSNLKKKEWVQCQEACIRQDAGNAYNQKLEYVLGFITYKLFRLTRGVTFGCFAELISVASALKRGETEDIL